MVTMLATSSNVQWQASLVVNQTMHPLKIISYMKSNLRINDNSISTLRNQKQLKNYNKTKSRHYLIDKRMVSIMPKTSGTDLQQPSTFTFLSLTSGKRHRAHSLGIRPICHNTNQFKHNKPRFTLNSHLSDPSQITSFCKLPLRIL